MAAIEGGRGSGERVLRIQVHERDERITFFFDLESFGKYTFG